MLTTRHSKRAGFTLLEMLVVVAVIGVLAASIFAVFARVREKGRSATCQSNLKQIALATQQYVQDSNGRYPPWDRGVIMQPYLSIAAQKLLFDCPSDPRLEERTGEGYKYNARQLTSILTTSPGTGSYIGRPEAQFANPALIWLHTDWPRLASDDTAEKYARYVCHVSPKAGAPCEFAIWHSGGANFSFIDGHVEWLTPEAACAMENAS